MTNAPDIKPDLPHANSNNRVADAPSDNWVYRLLPAALWPYAQLARWDRPIGWQLLMWPCFWSATLAANVAMTAGTFSQQRLALHLALFFIGSVAMRGAGCTWNDLVDQEIDNSVARTRSRPLPSGRVSRKSAYAFIGLQALVGLIVLLQFNLFAILLGVSSLVFVVIYPFAKRFTQWPQFFLGLAFSWGGLMGWACEFGTVSLSAVLLYAASVAWTIGYDTIYAHQDREDDALIGIGSTALLFAEKSRRWIALFYGLTMLLMALSFALAAVSLPAWIALGLAAILLAWQILILDIHDAEQCKALFKSNGRVGILVFAGLLCAIPFA